MRHRRGRALVPLALAALVGAVLLLPSVGATGAFYRAQVSITGVSATAARLVPPAPVCVPPSGLLTVPHLEWPVPSPAPLRYDVRYVKRGGGMSGTYTVSTNRADPPAEVLSLAGVYDFTVASRRRGWTSAASSAVTMTISQVAGLGLVARCGT